MKRLFLAAVLLIGVAQSGCAFLGGAALGTVATGAGYEINAKSQMDKLEDDYGAREFLAENTRPARRKSRRVRSSTRQL